MAEQVSSLKTGIKYKNTPIGKIPVDWEVAPLGKITYFEYGESLTEGSREKGIFPVYGSNGLIGYHSEPLVEGPGIIIGRKGSVGATTWVENDFWPIDTTYYISNKRGDVNLRWLFYVLVNLHLEKLNAATGVPGLNREEAHSVFVPIPPLSEQKKIARILTTVDEGIEKMDQIIEKSKEVKKGLMQKLLTRGIGHIKFKKTEIGEIPEEWEVGKLSDIAYIIMGQSPPGNSYNIEGTGYPILNGPTEFKDYSPTPIQFTTQPTKVCKAHDILFCVRGSSTGRMNIADQEYCIGRGLAAIREKSVSDTRYIYYILVNLTSTIFAEASGAGSTFPNISREALEDTKIVIPSLHEQKQIAEILSSVDDEIEKESNHKERLELLKKGLMQVLLTGKIRVSV